MLINKWSPPAGGTGMGGNSWETLLPVTYTPMRGVGGGGSSRDGDLLFAQNYSFLKKFYVKFTIYSIVLFGKGALG